MIIATLSFAPNNPEESAQWKTLFDLWLSKARAAAPKAHIVVLTNDETLCHGVSTLHIDTCDYRPRTVINNEMGLLFDLKGEIICKALEVLGPNVLYLDQDAFLVREPSGLPDAAIAMAHDADRRPLKTEGLKKEIRRCCAGIIWFGNNHAGAIRAFREARSELMESPEHCQDYLLEQWAWTIAANRVGRLLEQSWNYVPHVMLKEPADKAIVRHHHGPGKWEKLAKGELD